MIVNSLGGFGEGLEIAQNGVLNQFRLTKSILTVLAIAMDASDAIEDVLDVEAERPSQQNRLMKHAVSNDWMKGALFRDIHSAAQFFFQIDEQSPGEPRRRTRAGFDQQIDVAVLGCVAPGKGTEHTHPLHAVPGGDGENCGALILAQLIERHASPFSHQRQ
jgi:hypothetical protein